MLPYILPALLAGHGLAHISGFVASFSSRDMDYRLDRPWIFSGKVYLNRGLGRIFGLLWLIAAFILILTAAVLLIHTIWWTALALAGAVVSLAAIVPFWHTVPPGAKIGAAFDLVILVGVIGWSEKLLTLTS